MYAVADGMFGRSGFPVRMYLLFQKMLVSQCSRGREHFRDAYDH